MRQVNVHEAKTQFSKLLQEVEQGEEIILARGGKPVARMIRFTTDKTSKRKPGRLKGKIRIHESFFHDDPETTFSETTLFPKA